jgi:hypothetical protein
MYRPIDVGTLEMVDAQNESIVGYVFVEQGSSSTVDTVQRWVLYPEYNAPPAGQMILRPPSSRARSYATLDQWSEALLQGDLWRRGSKYVKVDCCTYSSPDILQSNSNQQIDDGTFKLVQATIPTGYGFSVSNRSGSTEYWVLTDRYISPSLQPLLVGPPGEGERFPEFSDFLEGMRSQWQEGYVCAVCNCTTTSGLPPAL